MNEDTGPKWLPQDPVLLNQSRRWTQAACLPGFELLTILLQASPRQAGTHPPAWSHSAVLYWLPCISLTETRWPWWKEGDNSELRPLCFCFPPLEIQTSSCLGSPAELKKTISDCGFVPSLLSSFQGWDGTFIRSMDTQRLKSFLLD